MTCKIEWNPIANMPIYICTAGEQILSKKGVSYQKYMDTALALGALALIVFYSYKAYRKANPIQKPVVVKNIAPGFLLKKRQPQHFKDQRGKSIQDYSSEGLRNPPKSFKLPNPLPKALKDDPEFPQFICPKTGQLIRNPVSDGKALYEKGEILDGQEVPEIAEFIRKKVYTYLFNKAVNKTPLKAAELREKMENGGDLNITDLRDKPLHAYLTEGIIDPPKGFTLPVKTPEKFENDPTYPKYICPLTQEIIRYAVLDPTDGTTLYEQSAIESYLQKKQSSPITREPLTEDDLVAVPNIARYIKMRLFKDHLDQQKSK